MKKFVDISFNAVLPNVTFARGVIASFFIDDDYSLNFINEVKTVISEAVTNAIVHGYGVALNEESDKIVRLIIKRDEDLLQMTIIDNGMGIENIEKAKEPLFTTKLSEERAGLGFTIMEIFSDSLTITSTPNEGTTIQATKRLPK